MSQPAAASTGSTPRDGGTQDGLRETLESVVIAFILAFLFRTFEAEAFVIPTGSMAPTLMGRHYDTNCRQCGYPIQAGASDESIDRIDAFICPNCRYEADVTGPVWDPLRNVEVTGRDYAHRPRVYSGDRIIVTKFPYEFHDPRRWDVAVFRYPATANTNYIKRIVGLPNETLRIFRGDIYTRPQGVDRFAIERKPPDKLLALMQVVYDNDYVSSWLESRGWPLRWNADWPASEGSWQPSEDRRTYRAAATGNDLQWLRYHHFVPTPEIWETLRLTPATPADRDQIERTGRQLISDFYSYNAQNPARAHSTRYEADFLGRHWVGDLGLEAELSIGAGLGTVLLELIEAGRSHRCQFDLATGQATLSIEGLDDFRATASTAVRAPGTYRVRFTNADDQLLLWINDRLVTFDAPTTFGPLPFEPPQRVDQVSNHGDWSPVAIGAQGVTIEARHLRVLRDVYYIADHRLGYQGTISEISEATDLPTSLLGGPFPHPRPLDFELGPDQFFALGDNSPKSKDSRLWDQLDEHGQREHYVHRELLIGKAMFIYWPHYLAPDWAVEVGWRRLTFDVPFAPNFWRMKFVH